MEVWECKELFENARPCRWDEIPDIDLYMDQVIGFMQRQHIGLSASETLTPAMINNYVKQKVLPKASGKRYTREHIAYLTAICLLKQVVSVGEVKELLDAQLGEQVPVATENDTAKKALKDVQNEGAESSDAYTYDIETRIESFYEKYTALLDSELRDTADKIDNSMDKDSISELALKLAVSSYAQKLACECLIASMQEQE